MNYTYLLTYTYDYFTSLYFIIENKMSLYLYISLISEPKLRMASKDTWGPSTWTLFHTLAEKVKDAHFNDLKSELLQYVKRICANLPCPDCAAHATNFISKLTSDQFATKQNFKLFLFHFHNSVNMRTKKQPFTVEELNSRYSRANTFVVVPHFIKVYSHRNTNVRLLVNSFQKDIMIKEFIKWIRENSHKFDK